MFLNVCLRSLQFLCRGHFKPQVVILFFEWLKRLNAHKQMEDNAGIILLQLDYDA